MRRLQRFVALRASDRRLLWRATALLLLTRGALRLLPFKTVHRLADRPVLGTTPGDPALTVIDRVAWAVDAAARCIPGSRCLPRALVALTLLRARGLPARLQLGLTRDGGRLLGHAWVEAGGRSIGDGVAVDRYVPLSTLRGDAR